MVLKVVLEAYDGTSSHHSGFAVLELLTVTTADMLF